MWPLGTYDRFLRKIKGQEFSQKKVNYFGVLFCDVRQSNAREYILNYLDVFNSRSRHFIDFYIPGYIPADEFPNKSHCNAIRIGNEKYIFDSEKYIEFCKRFEYDFDVKFPFSATLVLLEYASGSFSNARKIVFELESSENGIRSSGILFLNIFDCAENGKMGKSLDALSNALSITEKQKLVWTVAQCILNYFGIDVEPVLNQRQRVYKYKVK